MHEAQKVSELHCTGNKFNQNPLPSKEQFASSDLKSDSAAAYKIRC